MKPQCSVSLGGFGSGLAMVSLLRILPSRPCVINSPPPEFFSICRAASSASFCVRCKPAARPAPWRLLTQFPSLSRNIDRSEEHTSELQSLMRISYAVFCLKKKKDNTSHHNH